MFGSKYKKLAERVQQINQDQDQMILENKNEIIELKQQILTLEEKIFGLNCELEKKGYKKRQIKKRRGKK